MIRETETMKRPIAILLIAALAIALAGCSAAAAQTPEAAQTPAAPATAAATAAPSAPAETAAPEENSEPEGRLVVTFSAEAEDYYTDDGTQQLLRFSCAAPSVTISGRESAAAAINAALEEQRLLFVQGGADAEGLSGTDGFLTAAGEEYAYWQGEGMADNMAPFCLERRSEVTRGDSRVLSLVYADYTYTGGVHGYACRWAMNFDTLTGETLALTDLAEDGEAFLADAADRLFDVAGGAEYAVRGLYEDYAEALPGLLRDGNWYFSDDGLVVIANAYEIAPYAAGAFEFTLPWAWLSWRLKPEYVPESAADGELAGEIRDEAPTDAVLTLDDGTDGRGAAVVLTARGRVESISLDRVSYADNNTFWPEGTLWYVSALEDGETLCLRTWIPEIIPDLALSRTEAAGKSTDYISQSGKDGSLVLLPRQGFLALPAEISRMLPLDWDIDGDGERETLDLRRTEKDGAARWELLVDGTPAPGGAFALDGDLTTLWLCDLNFDGVAEIFFSGDMGSDDYVTCGWHGDTLEPVLFAGEDRDWLNPGETSPTVDGRATVSDWTLVLERWNYQLGTYCAVRPFELGDDGTLIPDPFREWEYRRNTQWLAVKSNLPVTMDEVGQAVLVPGEEIRLVSALGKTARFVTRDGEYGALDLEYRAENDNGYAGWYIDGVREDDYFEFLPYAG